MSTAFSFQLVSNPTFMTARPDPLPSAGSPALLITTNQCLTLQIDTQQYSTLLEFIQCLERLHERQGYPLNRS